MYRYEGARGGIQITDGGCCCSQTDGLGLDPWMTVNLQPTTVYIWVKP